MTTIVTSGTPMVEFHTLVDSNADSAKLGQRTEHFKTRISALLCSLCVDCPNKQLCGEPNTTLEKADQSGSVTGSSILRPGATVRVSLGGSVPNDCGILNLGGNKLTDTLTTIVGSFRDGADVARVHTKVTRPGKV